ncbi:MAG: hypothetical protein V2I24_09205 [Halieaceae bacterium]|jgi:hypothetical protein|nr:hypothetical protein [Halieaceae bacterium]
MEKSQMGQQEARTVLGVLTLLEEHITSVNDELALLVDALQPVLRPALVSFEEAPPSPKPECSCELAARLDEEAARMLELLRWVRDIRERVGL